jgi:MFS transporter, ACS family, tartrate transporter
LVLHRIGARVWIARILVTWGAVAIFNAFVRSAQDLYVVRFLLGAAEAGFFPGIILYLSHWFWRQEQARAIALFMTALPVATVIGSPLSGFILDRVHWLGLSSWRWLLIVEGIPAVVCGVLTYLLLPNRPEEAGFLSEEEKSWLAAQLRLEHREKQSAENISAARALTDGRVWHLAFVGFTLFVGMYAVIFWMPQTVRSLSSRYTNTTVGLLVMLPYLTAAVAMVLVSRSSDRRLERRFHVGVPVAVAGIALLCLGIAGSTFLSLILLSLVVAGGFSSNGPFWSMPSEFLTGVSAASGIALINSVANLGGFVGPTVIGVAARSSGSLRVALALASFSMFISAVLVMLLPKQLTRRE